MEANTKQADGFTLVEISIVMIIIGLLIGGTFGGMKLIENMQVNKTVQDLKSIESAALTFKDTYGRLPGDIVSPAARLPNCTVAPCATGGNGDRMIGGVYSIHALADTDEEFTFWQHLQAADLVSLGIKNTTDMTFGEGSPEAAIDGGYRLVGRFTGTLYVQPINGKHPILISENYNAIYSSTPPQDTESVRCSIGAAIDRKMDDARPLVGRVIQYGNCPTAPTGLTSEYNTSATEGILWFVSGF
jgi:prepilin-type N-terminal cleavage/methylation domain-containing protein